MLQHSLILESARAPSYDALAYLCTQTLNISREITVGESTVASALQRRRSLSFVCCADSLSSLDSSKFSNVLSRLVSEYASWLKIGILNSILKLTEASKASPDLDPLKLRSARSPISLKNSTCRLRTVSSEVRGGGGGGAARKRFHPHA